MADPQGPPDRCWMWRNAEIEALADEALRTMTEGETLWDAYERVGIKTPPGPPDLLELPCGLAQNHAQERKETDGKV